MYTPYLLPVALAAATTVTGQMSPTSACSPTPIVLTATESCSSKMISIYINQPGATGKLGTAMHNAALETMAPIQNLISECDVLSKLPTSAWEDFFAYETRLEEWWKTARTDFSQWASTCTDPMTGAFGQAVTAYLTQTAFLDTWTPTAAACPANETKRAAGSRQKVYTRGVVAAAGAVAGYIAFVVY